MVVIQVRGVVTLEAVARVRQRLARESPPISGFDQLVDLRDANLSDEALGQETRVFRELPRALQWLGVPARVAEPVRDANEFPE